MGLASYDVKYPHSTHGVSSPDGDHVGKIDRMGMAA